MKKLLDVKFLPLVMMIGGALGLILRGAMDLLAVDPLGLMITGHPARVGLWVLSLGMLVWMLAVLFQQRRASHYEICFPPSVMGAAGNFLLAVCIVGTVLLQKPEMDGAIGKIWKGLGLIASVTLIWAGILRLGSRRPNLVIHLSVLLFLMVHTISHYRTWSQTPELADYLFNMLGAMAVQAAAYYRTGFDVGLPKKRKLMGAGALTIFLCTVALWSTRFKALYAGCIFWVIMDLGDLWLAGKKAAR